MHHLVFGINFQIHSVSLTILVLINLLIHFSTHLSHHPHARHRSLLLSFTPGSKPTFSTNPSHHRFLLPTGLPHDNGTGPDLLRSSFYFLVSHCNFLFVPCGRLSWLPVSFLLHVKYALSYRIVCTIHFHPWLHENHTSALAPEDTDGNQNAGTSLSETSEVCPC